MTEHENSRTGKERPGVGRRHAFASATPHHTPIAAAPSAVASHIPDKLYFRIGEVARLCDVQAYVLRFWETEFPQLRPHKGGTGQRLFRRRDVEMALRIRHLLYDEGYTIPGARQLLKTEAKPRDTQLALVEDATTQQVRRDRLRGLYHGLSELHAMLSAAPSTQQLPPTDAPPPRVRRFSATRRGTPVSAGSLFESLESLESETTSASDPTAPPRTSDPR